MDSWNGWQAGYATRRHGRVCRLTRWMTVAGMAVGASAGIPTASAEPRQGVVANARALARNHVEETLRKDHVLRLRAGWGQPALREGRTLEVTRASDGRIEALLLPAEAKSVVPLFAPEDAKAAEATDLGQFFVVQFDNGMSAIEGIEFQAAWSDQVVTLGPSPWCRALDVPNDTLFPFQWSLRNTGGRCTLYRNAGEFGPGIPGVDIGFLTANDSGNAGEGAIIAVLDSGVLDSHPDLAGRIVARRSFLPGEDPNQANDDDGHGTHVAGICAAHANNMFGVAGIGSGATLAIGRVVGLDGGPFTSVAAGIVWAADIPGVRVINMSLGANNLASVPEMDAAIAYARSRGKVVVAAAGNAQGFYDDVGYPARNPAVIAVGSSDARDRISYFSDFGPSLDLVAPGEGILSTFDDGGSPTFDLLDGTSMATPNVSGSIALLASRNPGWSVGELEAALLNGAADRGVAGADPLWGRGRLRAARSLGVVPGCTADFNGDGFVDFFDYSAFVDCFSGDCEGGLDADIDRDGFVGMFDYIAFIDRFESGCSLSPPLSLRLEIAVPDDGMDLVVEPYVIVSWSEPNTWVEEYEVEVATDPGRTQWTRVATLPGGTSDPSSTRQEVPGLPSGVPFSLRLISTLGGERSVPCVPVSVPTVADLSPRRATGVVASVSDGGPLNVSWTSSGGAGVQYLVRWWPSEQDWSEPYATFWEQSTIVQGTQASFPAADLQNELAGFGYGPQADVPLSVRVVPFVSDSLWILVNPEGIDFADSPIPVSDRESRSAIATTLRRGCLRAPSDFRASSVGGTQVCFLWSDRSSCEDRQVIQQAVWNGSSWSEWSLGENVPPNRGDACRTDLSYNTRYRFRIRSESDVDTSPWSSEIEVTTGDDCLQPPGSFRVASVAGTQVCLLWNDTSSCEDRFVIEQSRWNGSSWEAAEFGENVPPNRGDACRTGLAYDTLYRFRIRAEIAGVRTSAWSNWAEARTASDCLQPPGSFRVASVAGNQVCLLWNDTSSCETRFVIEQSRWNGSSWDGWVPGENVPPNRGDACRTGLAYNTLYRFRVAAEIEPVRGSPWSNVVEATTGDDCVVVPGNFRVLSTGCGSVRLGWTDTSSCETRFVIEQSQWNGSSWGVWTFGENVPGNANSAVRDGLAADGLYRFRIRAEIEGVRASDWTTNNPEGRATPDCLDAPTNLRRGAVTPTSVELLWNDNSSCETQFQIWQRRFTNGAWSAWSLGENVPANAERAVRDGLVRGGLYQFYVIADQGSCESPRSNILEVDLPN
jgi:subtilisin family serine protease